MNISEITGGVAMPAAELLGIRLLEATPTRVRTQMTVRDDLCTTGRIAHGGMLMALADTTAALGAFLNLPPGANTTTIESKTNFLRAAPAGSVVTAAATPVHVGRRLSVWQTSLSGEAGKPLALIVQTQLVV